MRRFVKLQVNQNRLLEKDYKAVRETLELDMVRMKWEEERWRRRRISVNMRVLALLGYM
jgi:hypothetical protein